MEEKDLEQETLQAEEVAPAESVAAEPENGNAFDRFFGVKKLGSSFRTEIVAGIVTFLAMCYILTVNPNNILWGGGPGGTFNPQDNALWSSIFIATAIGAFLGTLLMALFARMPLAQAPGLGLNSTVGTLIGGGVGFYSEAYGNFAFSYANAMFLVLISGIVFLLLSVVPIGKNKETGAFITLREKIFDGMPVAIRKSISVGIGLFIAFIGLQNSSVITDNQYTLVQLVQFNADGAWKLGGVCCCAVVGLFSFSVITILSHFKVKGSVIIGIIAATLLAIPLKVADIDIIKGTGKITWKFWENLEVFFKSPDKGGVAFSVFTDGYKVPKDSIITCIMVIITFCMIDMFDTMGTVVGCTTNAGLIDENGKPINYNKIMMSDSIATVAGACLGTSTVTTFVESGSGIAAGGRTGLSSLVVAVLFLLSIFVLPIFAFIPTEAASGALLYVGVLMMGNVKDIDFKNPVNAVPAFITIIFMPLTYSITTGIGVGIIAYVVIQSIAWVIEELLYVMHKRDEKPKWQLSIVCLVIFVLFLVYFLVPTTF